MRVYDIAFKMGQDNAAVLDNLEKEMNKTKSVPVRKVIKATLKMMTNNLVFTMNPLNYARMVRGILSKGLRETMNESVAGGIDGTMFGLHIKRQGEFDGRPLE